jgi:hypothetical protein
MGLELYFFHISLIISNEGEIMKSTGQAKNISLEVGKH